MATQSSRLSDLVAAIGADIKSILTNKADKSVVDTKVDRNELTLNVKNISYNAKGDNSTDDSVALQSAFDTAGNLGLSVYIPAGNYRHSANLLIKTNGLTITGAGKDVSNLIFTGSGAQLGGLGAGTILQRWLISNLTLDIRQAAANSTALLMDNVGRSLFMNMRLICTPTTGGGRGIFFVGGEDASDRSTYFNKFFNIEIVANGLAIGSSGYANSNYFENVICEGFGIGLKVEDGTALHNVGGWEFHSCSFNMKNADNIILGKASGSLSSVTNFQFFNLRSEPSAGTASKITMHPNCVGAMFWGGTISGDVTIVRTGVNCMDAFSNTSTFIVGGVGKDAFSIPQISANTGITIGGDCNLYRSAANILSTDDRLRVDSILEIGAALTSGTQISANSIRTIGTSTDVTLNVDPKGTGRLELDYVGTATGGVRISKAAGKVGFYGQLPIVKPTVTGTNTSTTLTNLLAQLAAIGLISSTATGLTEASTDSNDYLSIYTTAKAA